MKIGLLGAGRIGKVHADAVMSIKGAKLAKIYDYAEAAAADLCAKSGAELAKSPLEILDDKTLDAVLICTPTNTHADYIKQAIMSKKAVFCEKPVDLNTQIVSDVVAFTKQHQGQVMIGFNRRFDPNFAALQRQIRQGAIGLVEIVQITSRDPSPPPLDYVKVSGGIFRDMTIHDFDMARFLVGEEFTEIFTYASNLVDPQIGKLGDVDSAVISLKTASGKLAQISNSRRASYGYDQRIEVHGSKGMIYANNQHETNLTLANGDGFSQAPLQNFFMTRYKEAYRAEIMHFIESLQGKITLSPSAEDGLKAQRLADAAQQSLTSGKPISL